MRGCGIDEGGQCGKPVKQRGMCSMHLRRVERHGNPHASIEAQRIGCSICGPDAKHHARGWCLKHYTRWYMNGDPLVSLARGRPKGATGRKWGRRLAAT